MVFEKYSRIQRVSAVLGLLVYLSLTSPVSGSPEPYVLEQINLVVDGRLDEWEICPPIPLDQLKDAGNTRPAPEDSQGVAKLAWNVSEPQKLYVAFVIQDDVPQFTTSTPDTWWFNDSVEIIIEDLAGNLTQWAFNMDGKTLHSSATPQNTQWALHHAGQTYTYEMALDLSQLDCTLPEAMEAQDGLRVSVQYNDGEEQIRQHQFGWIAGETWNVSNFGQITLPRTSAADVESRGRTASTGHITMLDTKFFTVTMDVTTGQWNVTEKTTGLSLNNLQPLLGIQEVLVDLSQYPVHQVMQRAVDLKWGVADVITTQYTHTPGLQITYTLMFLRNSPDILIRTDLVNQTGQELTIRKIASLWCDQVGFQGNPDDIVIVGDAKQYADAYSRYTLRTLDRGQTFFWYAALQQKAAAQAFVIGNLSNKKGIGKFRVTTNAHSQLTIEAQNDYEKILMPDQAVIIGEPVLISFNRRGVAALERFGTLLAQTYGVNARQDHPIDVDNLASLDRFNDYSHYGAAVIANYPTYHYNATKYNKPYEDPQWVQKNRAAAKALGFSDFGYFAQSLTPQKLSSGDESLVRNYGKPDFWFPAAKAIYDQHQDLYVNGMADFSNPELIAIEQARAAQAFRTYAQSVHYGFDFTNNWQKLKGQKNPFMTSAETFRAGVQPWRDLAKKHPSPYTMGFAYMSVIGFLYDLVDLVRIGADSDQGYHSGGCCTFIAGLANQISGRWFYNGKLWWNNPDTFHVYAGGLYTYNMGKVHATFTAITGNRNQIGEPFADQETPDDRLDIIRKISPTTPDTAVAVDMFEHQPARLWNMPISRPFGAWNVVALFNLDEQNQQQPITQEISFADLNLSADTPYLVYEFWTQQLLGTFTGSFTRTLPPIDCDVYAIVPQTKHPQLLSTTRHVRHMAYDVVDLKWNYATMALSGVSRMVKNYPHEMVIYVPENYTLKEAKAGDLDLPTTFADHLLRVTLASPESVNLAWRVTFEQTAPDSD